MPIRAVTAISTSSAAAESGQTAPALPLLPESPPCETTRCMPPCSGSFPFGPTFAAPRSRFSCSASGAWRLLPVSASESVWPACSGARGVVPFGADNVPAEFCGLAKKSKFVSSKNVGSHETQILEHVAACAGPARFVLRREPSCASPSAPTAPRGAASGPSGSSRSSRSSRSSWKTQKAEEAQKAEEGKEKPPRPGAAGGWKASLRLSLSLRV